VLVCILGFTLLKGVNVVRGMGGMGSSAVTEIPAAAAAAAARIVEVRE
jgi:hypothetical protein